MDMLASREKYVKHLCLNSPDRGWRNSKFFDEINHG